VTPHERARLAADITTRGIGTPLEVTSRGVVLDGHTRLAIARELGVTEVPTRTVDPADEAAYILKCATSGRHLTKSQRAALAVECDEYRAACADGRGRKLANLRQSPDVATLPHRGERSREAAARIADVSPRLVQEVAYVRKAYLEVFEDVRTGRTTASAAARRIRRAERYAQIAPAPPMPEGPFDLILADPPWQMGAPQTASCPENHYPTMTLSDIQALEIPAAEDAILYLWVVSSLLREGLAVMASWGFEYETQMSWIKSSIGPGKWVRNRHETVLIGTRGDVSPPDPKSCPDSVIEAPRGRHSAKPDELYERIERAHPCATKCELFARGVPRPGWTAWGNEVIPG
jgi:N6-adenosine-specific RNA methylase IME4